MSSHLFSSAFLKFERATKHRQEFEAKYAAFRSSCHKWKIRDDIKNESIVFDIETLPPPIDLPLILGDMFHCLRTALDHAIFAIVQPAPKDIRATQFPFGEDRKEIEKTKSFKLISAANKEAADMILNSLNPIKSGNKTLWNLHQLDIIDKHRSLLVTISLILTELPNTVGTTGDGGPAIFFWNQLVLELGTKSSIPIGHINSHVVSEPKFNFEVNLTMENGNRVSLKSILDSTFNQVFNALKLLQHFGLKNETPPPR